MKIVVHTIVKNEENFIWYSINSVLPFVDKIMIYDTGSSDRTLEIIHSIKSSKIVLKELSSVNDIGHTQVRQQMLENTDLKAFDWLMILDGDEIWPESEIKGVIEKLKKTKANTVIVRTYNSVGDIYHKLPESAGQYTFLNKKGHLAMRFTRTDIKNLNVTNPHGGQTYRTGNIALQDQSEDKLDIFDNFYIHTTHLKRSSLDNNTLKRAFKYKYEVGEKVKRSQLPEVFFKKHPAIVPEVTKKADFVFWLIAYALTIPKRIRRRFFKLKSGYI